MPIRGIVLHPFALLFSKAAPISVPFISSEKLQTGMPHWKFHSFPSQETMGPPPQS